MGEILFLQPNLSGDGASRLLVDVEAAVADGLLLGDRRPLLQAILTTLRAKRAPLLNGLDALRDCGPHLDGERGRLVQEMEALSLTLLRDVDDLIRRTEHLLSLGFPTSLGCKGGQRRHQAIMRDDQRSI